MIKNKSGLRRGFFSRDAEVHKWAEATSLYLKGSKNLTLTNYLDQYVHAVSQAQEKTGYIFTYNQFHFPQCKWKNLQIEHELYSMGHFIEACIAHKESFQNETLFSRGLMCADLICQDFTLMAPSKTPGHQEIEWALLKLYHTTHDKKYLNCAQSFLEARGKHSLFALSLLKEGLSHMWRSFLIKRKNSNVKSHLKSMTLTENYTPNDSPLLFFKAIKNFLDGRYNQQHTVIRKQKKPEGHAVRWTYMMTAAANLCQEVEDKELQKTLEVSWDHMVCQRMYLTGGMGSRAITEGFGRDQELPSTQAYCETCAAIGSVFFNWEMTKLTKKAQYAELTDWTLHNAVNVGVNYDGSSYTYRNPLSCQKNYQRHKWFDTPCCPSNISRLWSQINGFCYTFNNKSLWIHQYWGKEQTLTHNNLKIKISNDSLWPWNGKGAITIALKRPETLTLHLRIPGWCKNPFLSLEGKKISIETKKEKTFFHQSQYMTITKKWPKSTVITYDWNMDIVTHKKNHNLAFSRGPLLYCLEGLDTSMSPQATQIIPQPSLKVKKIKHAKQNLLLLKTSDINKKTIHFIPYFFIANRQESPFTVWVKSTK